MNENKELYLTNNQYLNILDMIENKLNNKTNISICDSNTIGDKYTSSNIGLCNDEFTTLRTALFLEDFKKYGRNDMKYRLDNHACPFDNRIREPYKKHGLMSLGRGCYYTCSLKNNKLSNEQLKDYVKDTRNKFLNGELDEINEILGR